MRPTFQRTLCLDRIILHLADRFRANEIISSTENLMDGPNVPTTASQRNSSREPEREANEIRFVPQTMLFVRGNISNSYP